MFSDKNVKENILPQFNNICSQTENQKNNLTPIDKWDSNHNKKTLMSFNTILNYFQILKWDHVGPN